MIAETAAQSAAPLSSFLRQKVEEGQMRTDVAEILNRLASEDQQQEVWSQFHPSDSELAEIALRELYPRMTISAQIPTQASSVIPTSTGFTLDLRDPDRSAAGGGSNSWFGWVAPEMILLAVWVALMGAMWHHFKLALVGYFH